MLPFVCETEKGYKTANDITGDLVFAALFGSALFTSDPLPLKKDPHPDQSNR
jgi:hypothetical protein